MGLIERNFRLTNEPGGLGLSCTAAGLSLAGVPLLQKFETGFAIRPAAEIEALVRAAYGDSVTAAALLPGFEAVARALNRGELARAMITAVLTRMPELGWDAAARLARTEDRLRKYNPFEPRDRRGRWTSGDGDDNPDYDEASYDLIDPGPASDLLDPRQKPRFITAGGSQPDDDDDELSGASSLERKYANLGPAALADQAIRFGDYLGREGKNFSPEEQQEALAEYNLLQFLVSFWQSYEYKPYEAGANLNSAAMSLFFGAQNAGIVSVKQIPASMLSVAIGAMALDDGQPGLPLGRPSVRTGMEHESDPYGERSSSEELYNPPEELRPADTTTGIVSYADVGLPWNGGVEPRGLAWQKFRADNYPDIKRLDTWSKTFDSFDDATEEAISEKTLNTLDYSYASNPRTVFNKLRKYIDQAADYTNRRVWNDINPGEIKSKTIEIAVPEYISPAQWQALSKGVEYGRGRGVKVNITVDKAHGSR